MDTKELMKQVGKIRVITNRLVDDHLSGAYHSVFRGQGIEFDEVREYVPGDDIRAIDWNVTARMGHPFIKRFSEEREMTVMFLVDISGSQGFGSGERTKAELAAEITCLLALSAIKNQDNVGLVLFSDRIEKSIPPRKGRTAVMRLVREVLAAEETRRGTDISAALRFLSNVQKRRAVVFIISDFMDRDYDRELRVMSRRHDVICCPVTDPRELQLVNAGLIEVQDPETGELCLLDTSSRQLREAFRARGEERFQELAQRFRRLKIDTIWGSTDRPFIDDVRKLFKQRQSRVGRA
ncbi:MAG: DUF58 domain-containing protein [Verrucomicrobia bacterium]|nr:DUF58 domain-containing protein [Verrucomicrobiota bacterium]MBT7702387.1 DUF58 domain-containing protein [Verrucomicrobiota bacterium]